MTKGHQQSCKQSTAAGSQSSRIQYLQLHILPGIWPLPQGKLCILMPVSCNQGHDRSHRITVA